MLYEDYSGCFLWWDSLETNLDLHLVSGIPLLLFRDIQQENFRGNHSHWRSFSFVHNHYLFFVCFLVVLLSILLYLLRLRRIHRRMLRSTSSTSLWMEEGLPPQKIAGALWDAVMERAFLGLATQKAIFASGFLLFVPLNRWRSRMSCRNMGKWGQLGLVSLDNICQKLPFSLKYCTFVCNETSKSLVLSKWVAAA